MINDHGAIIASERAFRERALETGTVFPQAPASIDRVTVDLDGLTELVNRTEQVFGNDLRRLLESHHRALNAPSTPPRVWHPLARLVTGLKQSIHGLQQGELEIDILSFVELHRVLYLYHRWRRDPIFPKVVAAANDPDNFRHDVAVLSAASLLSDAGLGAELYATATTRRPDLRVVVGLRQAFMVEVKAPRVIAGLPKDKFADLARRVLGKSLRNAMGQLESATPSVLLVGGPFWTAEELDILRDEARDLWTRDGLRRKHLISVLIVSTTQIYERRPETMSQPFDWSHVDFRSGIQARWVPNPHYSLPLTVTFEESFTGPYTIAFKPDGDLDSAQ